MTSFALKFTIKPGNSSSFSLSLLCFCSTLPVIRIRVNIYEVDVFDLASDLSVVKKEVDALTLLFDLVNQVLKQIVAQFVFKSHVYN